MMNWTKIKTKHFLFTDFSLQNHGALARLLCLTAHLERLPTESEMIRQVHYKSLKNLQDKLNEHSIEAQGTLNRPSIDLQYILNKVLEDVQGIEHKRAISRGTSRRYIEKQKLIDTSNDTTEKIREEKIREDKNKRYIVEVARATFDHYLVLFNKKEIQYQYTTKRRNKAEQRVRELFKVIENGALAGNPNEIVLDLMKQAVDNRKASKFHMGDNPQGKKYIDFVDHIFKSQEYTEQLIFEEKKQTQTKKPEWFNDLRKKLEERHKDKVAQNS